MNIIEFFEVEIFDVDGMFCDVWGIWYYVILLSWDFYCFYVVL